MCAGAGRDQKGAGSSELPSFGARAKLRPSERATYVLTAEPSFQPLKDSFLL